MTQETAESKILKARVRLLLSQPFFGNLLLYLEPVEKKGMAMPTLATDGDHLFYDPGFVMSLPMEHLIAVMVHEVGHIALRHLARRQGRNPMKWNLAADYAINDLIVNTTDNNGCRMFQLPPGILLNSDWHDQTAEWIYNKLPDATDKKTLDDHDQWKDFDKDGSSEAREQEWKDRVARAAVDAMARGTLPGAWKTVVDDFLEPKLDWKTILTDTIVSNSRNDYRMFPPNKKHIWRGFYLPSMRGEEISIMFGIDVSGSISDSEIQEALSEMVGIASQFTDYTIFLRCFDTRITGRWEIRPFDAVPQTVCGRGGTDFDEICREAEKTPGISTLVIFSDLEAPFPPEPRGIPIIWLSVGDTKPPFGFVIQYPRKEK
jgi:predicted metal-dependent peptidase